MKNNIILKLFLLTIAFTLCNCNGSFGRLLNGPDIDPLKPQIINSQISFSSIDFTQVTFSWQEAADNTTPVGNLEYLILQSTSNNIQSISDFAALPSGATAVGTWQKYPGPVTVSSLTIDTVYYFNVAVRNSLGKTALYASISAKPTDSTIPSVGIISATSILASQVDITWTQASDDYSAGTALLYKVVYSSSAINTTAAANALTGGNILHDWSPYATFSTATASPLTGNATYYFNVLVRDEHNNVSLYSCFTAVTSPQAPTVPNKALTFSDISTSGATLSWEQANDSLTPQASLEYMIIQSTSNNIGTITDPASLPSGATQYTGWITYPVPVNISSLTIDTPYFFNVIVRNLHDPTFIVSYTSNTVTPTDTTIPTVGTLSSTGKTGQSVSLSWTAGTDDFTVPAGLQYKIVYSPLASITQVSVADAITGSYILHDWSTYTTASTATASGLSYNTQYYFAVLVRDTHGNMALYTCLPVTTDPDVDVTAPTIAAPAVTVTNPTDIYHATLTWDITGTHDNVSTDANLKYKVVYSFTPLTSVNFSAATPLTDTAGDGWSDTPIGTLSGITVADGITTYFMVAVKDAAGNVNYYTVANYAPATVKSTLISYYKLDNNVNDSSTHAYAATKVGSATYSSGDIAVYGGYSMDFAGNDNNSMYVDSNGSTTTLVNNSNTAISISLWIKVSSFTNAFEQIICKGDQGFRLQRYGSTNKLQFYIKHDSQNNFNSRVISNVTVNDSTWHHVVCTFATGGSVGNEKIAMYIDGTNQTGAFGSGTDNNWYNNMSILMTSTAPAVRIGCNANILNQEYTGMVDDVRIYGAVLTQDEINALGN